MRVARRVEGGHELGRAFGVDDEQQSSGLAHVVGDLDVVDVDRQLGCQAGDGGELARAVGHRHADLGQQPGLGDDRQ